MPKIIVANVDSSAMCGSARPADDYAHSAMSAQRLLALATDEDLVVLPEEPSEDFLGYLNALLGRSLSSKNVVVPPGGRADGLIWTYDALNDGTVVDEIRRRAGDTSDWELEAYILDRPALALADTLGLRLPTASAGYLRAGGAESMNSKVVFRELADAAGTPVAQGRVVSTARELAHAARALLPLSGHVIVKQDLNLGGAGNTVLTLSDQTEFLGSRTTVTLRDLDDVDGVAGRLWPEVAVGRNTRAVVEAYHPASQVLYSEVLVHGPGRVPDLLNFGEMRMEPVFIGFEMPTQSVSVFDAATMAAHSLDLGRAAGERGFVGYMNIDSLITTDGRLLFTEVNGRMGACTHIDVLARELVGHGYQRSHVLLTRNRVRTASFVDSRDRLENHGLAFDPETQHGVIICAEATERLGVVEYIAIGRTLLEARDLEARAQHVLAATR